MRKSLRLLLWTLVLSTFVLGIEAYTTPRWMFEGGRLEGIGGVDFSEANFLPAFIGGVLPLMGSPLPAKPLAGQARGARGRGVFGQRHRSDPQPRSNGRHSLGRDSPRCCFAPRGYRMKIFAGLLVAAREACSIWPTRHSSRESQPSNATTEQRDRSSQSRLEIWALSLYECSPIILSASVPAISSSMPDVTTPLYQGRDAHNTYVRCFTELGIPGFLCSSP